MRAIGNRLAPRFNPGMVATLSVPGRTSGRGRTETFDAEEVPPAQREPLIKAYLRRYGKMPKVAASFRELPDPADHPSFRVVTTKG
jgi:hypothetical protein